MKEADEHGADFKKDWMLKRQSTMPKALTLTGEDFVKVGFLDQNQLLPLVVEPRFNGSKLHAWAKENLEFIQTSLTRHGGILFRGFDLKSLSDFSLFLEAVSIELMTYMESATPRTELSEKIYTSTEFPPGHAISLHNELTYVTAWPMKIWFFCLQPSETGGETPIADVRRVFNRISPAIRDRFIRKGWILMRNFNDGLGLSWQASYHTTDREAVERYFVRNDIEFEWKEGERLRTRQVRPAVARHPKTGEMVWFNHVAFWNVSGLDKGLSEAVQAIMKEEDLPYNTYYGDGRPIEPEVIEEIREAYKQETVIFRWQAGDVLMLDNMLVAHGRNPYTGERKILVAMGEPSSDRGL